MATPIRIGALDAGAASDLVDALAVRGLIGTVSETGGGRWVELHEAHEETERFLAEVIDAVAAWLLDRDRPGVDVCVEDRTIPVEPREQLDDALRARLPGGAPRGAAER